MSREIDREENTFVLSAIPNAGAYKMVQRPVVFSYCGPVFVSLFEDLQICRIVDIEQILY